MLKNILKHKVILILSIIAILIAGVVLIYNFGWRLWGFSACNSPKDYITYRYQIQDDSVEILIEKGIAHDTGRTLGFITEEKDGILKVGIKYNKGFVGLIDHGSWWETLNIPVISKPDKIILCGNGFEIDINDHVNEEMYKSYLYVENLSDMQKQKSE